MKLPFPIVIYKLSHHIQLSLTYINTSEQCTFHGLFFCTDHHFDKDYLYCVNTEDLQQLPDPANCSGTVFLYICPPEQDIHMLEEKDYSIIVLRTYCSWHSVINEILHIYRIFEQWDRTVHEAIIKKENIQYILDAAESICEYPIAIFDVSFSLIAYTQHIQHKNKDFATALEQGYTPYTIIQQQKKSKLFQKLMNTDALIWEKAGSSMEGKFKVSTNGKTIAFGGFFDCDPDCLRNGYGPLADFILSTLTTFLLHHSAQKEYRYSYENFLENLIRQEIPEEQISEQLRHMTELHESGFFTLTEYELSNALYEPLEYTSTYIRNNTLFMPFIMNNHLFVLENSELFVSSSDSERNKKKMLQILEKYEYAAGVSMPFYHLIHIKEAFAQCQIALKYARQKHPFGNIHFRYDGCLISNLLDALPKNRPDMTPCFAEYALLRKYDEEHHTKLCHLLAHYIMNNCNSSMTAKKMYIHKNTILYKLRKIEELTQFDFDSFQNRLYYLLLYFQDADQQDL